MGIESHHEGRVSSEVLELIKLASDQPLKEVDPQGYYTYKAREHQIRYDLFLKKAESKRQHGHQACASHSYEKANAHLKKRDRCIEKVYEFWLKAAQSNKNPPHIDMLFIQRGIHLNQLLA